MRLFQRASRRAELPVTLTKGFNPHLKISITKALKLGVESNAEEAVFSMERRMGTDDFKLLFNKALPAGIRVESVEELASNG
jgi:radical SAM-linked protein